MFSFSVAFDSNQGIGINGVLPWHIKEELQLFKKNTLHKNILMGQTTYDKLPGKLKNRNIFVVSWEEAYQPEGVTVVRDLIGFWKKIKIMILNILFVEEHQSIIRLILIVKEGMYQLLKMNIK